MTHSHACQRHGILIPSIPFVSDLDGLDFDSSGITLGPLCIPQSLPERDIHPLLSSRPGGIAEMLLSKPAQRVFSEKHFNPVQWASLGGWNTEQYRSLGFIGYGFRGAQTSFDFSSIAQALQQKGAIFLPEIQGTLVLKGATSANPELLFTEIRNYRYALQPGFSEADLTMGAARLLTSVINHATSNDGQLIFELKPSEPGHFFLTPEIAALILPELHYANSVDKTIRDKGWHTDFYLKPATFSGQGRDVLRVRYNHSFMLFESRDPDLARTLQAGLAAQLEPHTVSQNGQAYALQYRARTLREASELLYHASRFLAEHNESFLILEDTIPLSVTKNGFRPEVRVILQKNNARDLEHLVTADYVKMGTGVTANIAQGSKGWRTDKALAALFAHTLPNISRKERGVFVESTLARIYEASKATVRDYGDGLASICGSLPPFLVPGMIRYGLPDIAVDVGIHVPPYCPKPENVRIYCIEINESYACNGAGLQSVDPKAFDRVMRQRRELNFQLLASA